MGALSPPELAADPGRSNASVVRRAALAAPNHTNIDTIYSVEQEGDANS